MSIQLLNGGTTATTGGTAQIFKRTNTSVSNGYEYADTAEADFFKREKVVIAARQPALGADGTYTKQKASFRYVKPLVRADGTTVYNLARTEVEFDPETPTTDLAELREMGAQCFKSAAFNDVFTAGTLPE